VVFAAAQMAWVAAESSLNDGVGAGQRGSEASPWDENTLVGVARDSSSAERACKERDGASLRAAALSQVVAVGWSNGTSGDQPR